LYDPAERAIEAAGGEVRLGASVSCVEERRVFLASGEAIDAQRVVLAVPPERAASIVSESLAARDGRFEAIRGVAHSPILGVHITLDREVMKQPHAVLVSRGTQWVFNKGASAQGGQRLHAVVSAADDWMELDEAAIVQRVMDDVAACFPKAGGASVTHARAVKEKRATFAPTPEFEQRRPKTISEDSSLVLAGDYTDTGWPATMEGAVRSGNLAAAAILDKPRDWAIAETAPPSWLASALGGAGLRASLALTR
jgi:predicted NAD/FAD-dependent oxidoreductase